MRTGLDFKEEYGWNPFSKMAQLYYGKDVVSQFRKLSFRDKPGNSHYYNSWHCFCREVRHLHATLNNLTKPVYSLILS